MRLKMSVTARVAGILLFLLINVTASADEKIVWPNGAKVAVSLSYDDALDSQLDNAVPSLDGHGLKASFYLTLVSSSVRERLEDWRSLAANGHELGNHTIYHPCSGSLPDRDWVQPYRDTDTYTLDQMVDEVVMANTILNAIDGETRRTFTPPCDDLIVDGVNYLLSVDQFFVAIKGQSNGMPETLYPLFMPDGESGQELIDYVTSHSQEGMLLNILFHGIGGDHLAVSSEAHAKLLRFLAENSDTYWVDTFLNIMTHAKAQRDTAPGPTSNR